MPRRSIALWSGAPNSRLWGHPQRGSASSGSQIPVNFLASSRCTLAGIKRMIVMWSLPLFPDSVAQRPDPRVSDDRGCRRAAVEDDPDSVFSSHSIVRRANPSVARPLASVAMAARCIRPDRIHLGMGNQPSGAHHDCGGGRRCAGRALTASYPGSKMTCQSVSQSFGIPSNGAYRPRHIARI